MLFILADASQQVLCDELNILELKQKCTFLFSDEVLDNDISHAVPISVAILVEAVNCAEDKLVAGDGPILAGQHLKRRDNNVAVHPINTSKKRPNEWENVPVAKASTQENRENLPAAISLL